MTLAEVEALKQLSGEQIRTALLELRNKRIRSSMITLYS